MAQAGDVTAQPEITRATEQQPAQPSSPSGSTSSREEKNAREKLKKTSIAGLKQHMTDGEPIATDEASTRLDPNDVVGETMNSNGTRGRPAKKRSFEDLAKDDAAVDAADSSAQPPEPKSGHHKRMRSRDIATGDNLPAYTKVGAEKSETLHEETDMDAQISPGGPGVLVDAPSQEEMEEDEASQTINQQPESGISSTSKKQGSSLDNKPGASVPSGSGFANASTSSPFGQTKSPQKESSTKVPEKVTSPSAFASSGLSAFASTEKSPFGVTASSKSPGGFGSGSTSGFGSSKGGFGSSTGGFGGATTSSGFGSGGGFGSAKGFGSTFGAPKPFGSTAAFGTGGPGSGGFGTGKPFTSTSTTEKVEEEEGENEEDEDAASVAKEDADQDPRFHEQQGMSAEPDKIPQVLTLLTVDTGEEGEETHFSARARLYFFSKDGGWKERGTGTFKINIRMDDDSINEESSVDVEAQAESATGRRKARLLMRADATHRVILNTPVFRGMRFGAPDGTEPTGKIMHLQSLEESKPVPLQIKVSHSDKIYA